MLKAPMLPAVSLATVLPAAAWLLATVLLFACGDDAMPIDAAVVRDSAADGGTLTQPEFDYIPVDGAVCANGTPLGMGLSAHEGASTLVVFVNGGGACWDSTTCFALNSAVHISTTYDASVLAADLAPLLGSALVQRGGESPIADATMAFIPYCTGDLHAGTVVREVATDLIGTTREVHHVGRVNMQAFTAELAARFPAVDRVVLVGFSAGGFGSVLNADLFDAAFGQTVDVLADGAPFIQPSEYATWRNQWQMALPEGCADCTTRFEAALAHQMSGRRHGLITTTNDGVIRVFFGYALEDISGRTLALVEAQYGQGERHAWAVTGTDHVLLGGYATRGRASGPSLKEWTDAFFDGGDAFATWTP